MRATRAAAFPLAASILAAPACGRTPSRMPGLRIRLRPNQVSRCPTGPRCWLHRDQRCCRTADIADNCLSPPEVGPARAATARARRCASGSTRLKERSTRGRGVDGRTVGGGRGTPEAPRAQCGFGPSTPRSLSTAISCWSAGREEVQQWLITCTGGDIPHSRLVCPRSGLGIRCAGHSGGARRKYDLIVRSADLSLQAISDLRRVLPGHGSRVRPELLRPLRTGGFGAGCRAESHPKSLRYNADSGIPLLPAGAAGEWSDSADHHTRGAFVGFCHYLSGNDLLSLR